MIESLSYDIYLYEGIRLIFSPNAYLYFKWKG